MKWNSFKRFFTLVSFLTVVTGSRIEFSASPSVLKTNITSAVSMRCSLVDTEITRAATVTNTSQDVRHISHILVSKHEGSVIVAEGSVFEAPMALADVGNLDVKGNISPSSSHGFIELSWKNPALVDAADYWCEIQTVDAQHHQTLFKSSLTLQRETPTLEDLVAFLQTQAQTIRVLDEKQADQTKVIEQQAQDIKDLKQEDAIKTHLIKNLTSDFSHLKQCQAPESFFMATFSSTGAKTLGGDKTVIYDKVITNVGGNYNSATGVFTADTAGIYAFSVSSFVNDQNTHNNLNILVNSRVINSLVVDTDSSDSQEMGFGRAVVALTKGDRVLVQTEGGYSRMHTFYQASIYEININTFSGELLKPTACN